MLNAQRRPHNAWSITRKPLRLIDKFTLCKLKNY
jgi:hypothetical protein